MLTTNILFSLIILVFSYSKFVTADNSDDLNICEDQLNKYRKFILDAILSFDDACELFEYSDDINRDINRGGGFNTRNFKTRLSGAWPFYRMLMTQFNDIGLSYSIKKALIERCRREEVRTGKREPVSIGKPQRFHSWGGKRSGLSSQPGIATGGDITEIWSE